MTPDGATRWLDQGVSAPVGASADLVYREAEDQLPPASALVLYTDGLVERRGESIDAGLARLAAAAADCPGHAGTLAGRLALGASDAAQAGRRRRARAEPPPGRRQRRCWSGSPPRRPRSRRCATACAAGSTARASSGPSPRDLLLAAGEAASNAVEHPLAPAPAAIVLDARRTDDGYAEIAVRDHGRWNDEPSAPHRGRGMEIIQAIVGEGGDVRVDRTDGGTTISFRRRLGEEVP